MLARRREIGSTLAQGQALTLPSEAAVSGHEGGGYPDKGRTPRAKSAFLPEKFGEMHESINLRHTKMPGHKENTTVFRERRTQFVNPTRKGPSKGELNSLKAAAGIDDLRDREGKAHAQKNLTYSVRDIEEDNFEGPSPRDFDRKQRP